MSAKILPIARRQNLCLDCAQEAEKYDNPQGCAHCERLREFKEREERNRKWTANV